jgi:hypothetical protein
MDSFLAYSSSISSLLDERMTWTQSVRCGDEYISVGSEFPQQDIADVKSLLKSQNIHFRTEGQSCKNGVKRV